MSTTFNVHPVGRIRSVLAAFGLVVALAVTLGIGAPQAQADDDEILPDGLTEATAAASCWEIKQNTPSAPSGVYWLVTPRLVYPQQFYCDQETDGGGWVLIGRGRQGWSANYDGSRSPAQVRNTPDGIGAFPPAQLPSETVDGLLDGGRVDELADGVRVRRAADANGSTWQELRFDFASRDRWVWALNAEHRVGNYEFDNPSGADRTGSGGTMNNFGRDNGWNRLNTAEQQAQGWVWGLGYGADVRGTSNSGTYLWSTASQGRNAIPFAQMFLRPELRLADLEFETVPAGGTPVQEQAPIAESGAMTTQWGVSGLANGQGGELNVEVAAFGEVDGVVYVGGNFRYVQRDSSGTDRVEQPYVAAFDADTGEWISSFRPELNGQVKALYGMPDGRVAVGGQFSRVNGETHAALVFLDATTGELSGDQVVVENRTTGGSAQVRGFDLRDGYLYVSGGFTHLIGDNGTTASAWNGGRIAVDSMRPDPSWNAFVNGTSVGVDASQQGDRVYLSGYFRMKGEVHTPSAVALRTDSGAALVDPLWKPSFSKASWNRDGSVDGNVWQFGVAESEGRVYLGGSEHSLFGYDRTTFELRSGTITKAGGDFQAVIAGGGAEQGLIYAGCHCGDWSYQDAYTWQGIGNSWTQGDTIDLVGAWDGATGDRVPQFAPQLVARAGYGIWAIFEDSNGTLWVGGDLSRSVRTNGAAQWAGGFTRFAPADTQAPSAPDGLHATPGAEGLLLQWEGSSDDRGNVEYEVLRDGVVIASTSSTSALVPLTEDTAFYAVRARDAAENRSASTAPLEVAGVGDIEVMIEAGSSWRWRFSNDPWPQGWNEPGFDASSWESGVAPLGAGASGLATDLNDPQVSPLPLSAQFVQSFDLESPWELESVTLSVVADDGVVVWVNGQEVGRTRMPEGTVSQNTYASGVVSTSSARANPTVIEVPTSVLVEGENVVAASTHANYRATANRSFELSMSGIRGDGEQPSAPGAVTDLVGEAIAPDQVQLTWAPGEGAAPQSYLITRDGEPLAQVSGEESGYLDDTAEEDTTYTYGVTARGPWSQTSAESTVTVTTLVDRNTVLVEAGSSWRWRFSNDPWPEGWNEPGFDASSWESGQAMFGVNAPGQVTDLNAAGVSPRPLSGQFLHTFEVSDPSALESVTLSVIADDGVVVWVNGQEVGRTRMPEGDISYNTYPTAAPSTSTAVANPSTFDVPVELLTEGENTVAASMHSSWRASPNLSFDLWVDGTLAP